MNASAMLTNNKPSDSTVRTLPHIAAKLAADPAARVNLTAFVTVVVRYHIAFERPVTRHAASCESLQFPADVRRHFRDCARAKGGRTVADIVTSALEHHYFGPTYAPGAAAAA